MCHGRQCRTICLQFLLAATAIQGITPDAQDLASINAFLILCPRVASANHPTADDGLPDDVCGLTNSENNVIVRGRIGKSEPNLLEPQSMNSNSDVACLHLLRLTNQDSHAARIENPIQSTCRLKC